MTAPQALAQRLLLPLSFSIVVLLLNLVFMAFGTYEQFLSLDRVMHFSGGLAAAWVFVAAFETTTPRRFFPLFVITCTLAITILWECLEFFFDFYWNAGLMGNAWDTFEDMALGTGASIVILSVKRFLRAQKSRQ